MSRVLWVTFASEVFLYSLLFAALSFAPETIRFNNRQTLAPSRSSTVPSTAQGSHSPITGPSEDVVLYPLVAVSSKPYKAAILKLPNVLRAKKGLDTSSTLFPLPEDTAFKPLI